MTQQNDEENMGIYEGKKCQMVKDRDKQDKSDMNEDLKGVPQ